LEVSGVITASLPIPDMQDSSQITFLRKSYGSRLNVFAPVNDLSALSKTGSVDKAGMRVPGQKNDVAIAGGQILGDEWSDHVVKVRIIDCVRWRIK
jgi:hypothetical protein